MPARNKNEKKKTKSKYQTIKKYTDNTYQRKAAQA